MPARSSPPPAARSEEVLSLLRSARRPLLVGHVQPDGDCAGSQAALASVLESLGQQVRILNPDPLAPHLDHLAVGRRFGVYRGSDLPAHDVAVLLDFSDRERCGSLAAPLAAAPSRKVVIDHHPFEGEVWWDAAWIDPTAAATGLLVHRIASALGARLDHAGAVGAFTALVTDTGWFRYPNTDAEVLAVAAELVAGGVDPAAVHRAVFQRASRERPLGVARALSRLEYLADGRLAVVALPRPAQGEADLADGDEVLDLMRAVERVEVALFLRETRAAGVKLSARSKGDFDVNALARRFGGGGHLKAAGATLEGPLSAARERVVASALGDLGEAEARSA